MSYQSLNSFHQPLICCNANFYRSCVRQKPYQLLVFFLLPLFDCGFIICIIANLFGEIYGDLPIPYIRQALFSK